MNTCPNQELLDRWFDGEAADPAIERHVDTCPHCGDYLRFLRVTREAVAAAPAVRLENGQMPAYLTDLRGRIHRRRVWGRIWTAASVAAAAVIAATALLTMVTQGPGPVQAHSVIEAHSDILGATTETIEHEGGAMTVWLNLPEDEMQ